MNGIQSTKSRNLEMPFPGCLGRMVNLFDLNTGVARNRLLTDKPYLDGSPPSRSGSDVARMTPINDQIEDKVMVSELRRNPNGKSNVTPMKMLIAQEMSKDIESKHNPPSLVAKLMGIDALPRQQLDSAVERGHSRSHSRTHSDTPLVYRQQEQGIFDSQIQPELQQCQEQNEYRDIYEIWQQSQKASVRDRSPQKAMHIENTNEKKMALVRQKFIEAKRLATDEKLRQSKEFQDALEVLSTNKELFLKFLQEPNSLFSKQSHDRQYIPPPETKRITVLRPSKMVDANKLAGFGQQNERKVKKASQVAQVAGYGISNPNFSPRANPRGGDNSTQPTRIVVLKPSPGKLENIRTMISLHSSLPTMLHDEELYEKANDSDAHESREVAREITRQMRENLSEKNTSEHQRDDTLLSSVLSNGYNGDESSFNKSEYAAVNLSDSEIMSPTSRHSWDYIQRFGSPYSPSAFSRASYSPESSVCREAKKRLSERWAMMASSGICPEQRHVQRSSSTLGEMLALSDSKKPSEYKEGDSYKVQEPRGSTSCLTNDQSKDENVVNSPRNLLRSKSVPVSSTVYGARLNVEFAEPEVAKIDSAKDLNKAKSAKSSLKGKVSNLFFSRTKRSIKEKSQSNDDSPIFGAIPACSSGEGDSRFNCSNNGKHDVGPIPDPHRPLGEISTPSLAGIEQKQVSEAGLAMMKPVAPVNQNESQGQPSPISVLEPPFEEDYYTTLETSGDMEPGNLGERSTVNLVNSNLIDKSPPIGSVSRTLSWDDSSVETATPYPEEEDREWLFFVQTLISATGLDAAVQSDSSSFRWHSHESLLDPSLRDNYVDLNEKQIMHEAKRRQRRSTCKLVFDFVNAELLEMTGYGSDKNVGAKPVVVVDQVWSQMKEWFSGDVRRCVSVDDCGGDGNNSLVVERVVRKEVVGRGWVEHMRMEIDNLGKEIEGKLLEELVLETLVELTTGTTTTW